MDFETFLNIIEEYTIYYKITEGIKGNINYKLKRITINPCYNEEGLTLCHEAYHHYYDFILCSVYSEQTIEDSAKIFYAEHKSNIESLVDSILRN